jgi:hypothetical protein
MAAGNPFFAGLLGHADPLVVEAIQNLSTALYSNAIPRIAALEGKAGTTAATSSTGTATSSVKVLQGTHTTRVTATPASGQALGTIYWETDRDYLYIVGTSGGSSAWFFVAGISFGTLASKWTGLVNTDAGALYYTTDKLTWWQWNGTAWVDLSDVINAVTGFTINNGAAAAGHYLRGNGTRYVDGTIQNGDLPNTVFGAGTAVLAKITGGGANGSLSWDTTGRISAYVAPT